VAGLAWAAARCGWQHQRSGGAAVVLCREGEAQAAWCGGAAAVQAGRGGHGCGVGLLYWACDVPACRLRAKALTSFCLVE
jgi:hypothetical protein